MNKNVLRLGMAFIILTVLGAVGGFLLVVIIDTVPFLWTVIKNTWEAVNISALLLGSGSTAAAIIILKIIDSKYNAVHEVMAEMPLWARLLIEFICLAAITTAITVIVAFVWALIEAAPDLWTTIKEALSPTTTSQIVITAIMAVALLTLIISLCITQHELNKLETVVARAKLNVENKKAQLLSDRQLLALKLENLKEDHNDD